MHKFKKILVTGADGFIGSHLVEHLMKSGNTVKAFVQYNSFNFWGWLENIPKELKSDLEVFSGDIRDSHGVKTAVVTSSNMSKMESVYSHQPGFKSLFDAILTSEDFVRSKPDPDCYLKAAQILGAQTDECIVFEDSFNGLRSGRAAGIVVVGLSTTNPSEAISPFSDLQIPDYVGLSYERLSQTFIL